MHKFIQAVNSCLDHPDLARLILRVSFSAMFLLHGIHKIFGGTAFIQGLFVNLSLPGYFAYAVYLGEVVAPVLIILGIFTRLSALVMVGTCLVIIGLMHTGDFFTLNQVGAWAVEGVAVYLFAALTIALLGSGKYALKPNCL